MADQPNMLNESRMTAEYRYRNDPMFRRIVDSIRSVLHEHYLTPTEVREAAVFACCLHERDHINPSVVMRNG